MEVPPLPKTFDLQPFLGIWHHWSRVEKCFCSGKGQRAASVDPELAPIRQLGGTYIFAAADHLADSVSHTDASVIYVGETSMFRDRMAGWGRSAGFWGEPQNGHSAGWRWKEGPDRLSVAFFDLSPIESRHFAKHVRAYFEVIAMEEFRAVRGGLPRVNEGESVTAD